MEPGHRWLLKVSNRAELRCSRAAVSWVQEALGRLNYIHDLASGNFPNQYPPVQQAEHETDLRVQRPGHRQQQQRCKVVRGHPAVAAAQQRHRRIRLQ